ncbi:MAG: two-component sensor histidine kinase [Phyllobacteriaceae bacterium]|nr:two-component sensor histidine kinase [Phyllobacteriaceae bacterium]
MTKPKDMDDLRRLPETTPRSAITARVARFWPLLVAIPVVLIGFVLWGGLKPEGALLGGLFLVALIALIPHTEASSSDTVLTLADPPLDMDGAGITAFVEALIDPCLVLDRRGEIVHRNEAAARNYPQAQPGRVLTLVMRHPALIAAIDHVLETGEARSFELHETFPTETWDRVHVAPLHGPETSGQDDDDRQILITFQSLTDLKRVEALRSDFIANASHELRTPLASVIGFIDTLLGPAAKDPAAREKFLGIMRAQADRMSRLIDDLLSLSRIEMHQHVRPTGTLDLAALLREVRDGLQALAGAAELKIVLTMPEGPVTVSGDRNQLYEVFENLIDNAIKYGGNGKTIDVTLARVERGEFRHLVAVVDHGPGVDPEHVPRMTERFYRIDAETSRKKKGTGLGLAIVKHIVHRHRGQISIKSRTEPGEGLRIEVVLP